MAEAFPEILADISNLFITHPEDDPLGFHERRKIDSLTLDESEYDNLLEEHFLPDTRKGKFQEQHMVPDEIFLSYFIRIIFIGYNG